ncbi:NACHT domain-containing protein [Fusarium austroafricanum]|uniref:NACHT domain-containing protein n=1 Tax=Fusarium austroafricanum TaxID=2364996 RepID=A0A8H4P5Q6_9HYPO|nr:NACHT domain-containing protein [Fusarium austroafricanum]
MAQRVIQIACDRFRSEISPDDASRIEATTTLDDVKLAISQVERQLAARQLLRDMDRITPFIDAIERYSKALEVAANGTPYLPWIWAPIKFVILAVQDNAHALDKILSAYGNIGLQMPRFSRFAEAFPGHRSFQHLMGFLFEDILEFHRRSYALIRKPGWKVLFKTAWGGFDHRFSSLLDSIARAVDQRRKEAEASAERETRWHTQQLCIVQNWLESSHTDQEWKFGVLRDKCHEGTLNWVISSPKLRDWLQRGHGKQVLWLYGKPGSGMHTPSTFGSLPKADIVRRVSFFFCDFNTQAHAASTEIFRALTAQILSFSPDAAPFVYGEYIANGKKPTTDILKKLLPQLIADINDIRLIVDGLDEISSSEHRKLIIDLLRITKDAPHCKMLLVSQDVPSISVQLSKHARFSMVEESANTRSDLAVVLSVFLKELDSQHDGALGEMVLQSLRDDILQKAEGMFLWVHLVLEILVNASCLEDLRLQISSLPATLAEAYSKILNNICSRCSAHDVARIRRIFAWLKYHKGKGQLRKHQVRIGASLFPGRDILRHGTSPLPNMTDICKPLIEDGPDGCLVFVHSTVPQFLEEYETPFIDRSESQASIAYACVCQLSQGLDLLITSGTSFPAVEMALGLLSLFPYSFEYWIEHLLDALEVMDDNMPEHIQALLNRVNLFCQKIAMLNTCELPDSNTFTASPLKDQRLGKLMARMDPSFARLMVGWHDNSATNNDQSTLAQAMLAYQNNVEFLLRETNVIGVSHESLLAFKELHSSIAFRCNVRGCEHAIIGFPSREKLKNHQVVHSGALKCHEISCTYKDIGFTTQRRLKEHRKRYHGTGIAEQLPKRMRRARKLSPEIEHNNHPAENGWNYVVNPQAPQKLIVKSYSGKPRIFAGHDGDVCTVCFVPDGKTLVAGGEDSTVRFWDIGTGSLIVSKALPAGVTSIAVSPDCKYVAAGCLDDKAYIFEMGSKSQLTATEGQDAQKGYVYSVAFTPDGKQFATASADETIKIWDLGKPLQCLRTLVGHENFVRTVAFTRNARWVVSSSDDKKIRFWDLQTGEYQGILTCHTNSVNSVAVSPEGCYIASIGEDSRLCIWRYQEL